MLKISEDQIGELARGVSRALAAHGLISLDKRASAQAVAREQIAASVRKLLERDEQEAREAGIAACKPIGSEGDLERAAKRAGSHFFDESTMRFFGSKIASGITRGSDGRIYFITSERRPRSDDRRAYAVRVFDGQRVETIGEVQKHRTLEQARKALREASGQKLAR